MYSVEYADLVRCRNWFRSTLGPRAADCVGAGVAAGDAGTGSAFCIEAVLESLGSMWPGLGRERKADRTGCWFTDEQPLSLNHMNERKAAILDSKEVIWILGLWVFE